MYHFKFSQLFTCVCSCFVFSSCSLVTNFAPHVLRCVTIDCLNWQFPKLGYPFEKYVLSCFTFVPVAGCLAKFAE